MKPYNHVVDAGCPDTMPIETLLVRLVSVEMRMPVLLTKSCADRLAKAGHVAIVGAPVESRTTRDRTATCVRVDFTKRGRDAASSCWFERKASAYCRHVAANPGVDMCARRSRLLVEHGLIDAVCNNPKTVKGESMPATKRRYVVALTELGRQLLET